MGIAYSFGFIIGPVVGAVFAKRSSLESGNPYLLPALFAITLTVADLMFVYVCLRESLPKEKRVMHFIKFFTFPFRPVTKNRVSKQWKNLWFRCNWFYWLKERRYWEWYICQVSRSVILRLYRKNVKDIYFNFKLNFKLKFPVSFDNL